MLLQNKSALVIGGSGVVGSTIARAMAAAGADVTVAARNADRLRTVAAELDVAWVVVDARTEQSVAEAFDDVMRDRRQIDVVVNAFGFDVGDQGVSLTEMPVADFMAPVEAYIRGAFLLTQAAVQRMIPTGGGTIVTVSLPMARVPAALSGVFGPTFAFIEAMSHQIAAEHGPAGIRAVCLRPTGMPESASMGSHTTEVWRRAAERLGWSMEEMLAAVGAGTMRHRPLQVREVADAAVFAASDLASGMTGTALNVTAGSVPD